MKLRRHRRIPGKILETEARIKTRRERLMNKKLFLSIIAGFVLGLVILWFLGFEINPF